MKRSLLALALVAVLPFAAQADDKLSYTYVEGTYLNTQADGDIDADGFGVRGSFEFGDSGFYALGGYNQVEIDDVNVDVDNFEIGVGYGLGLSDNVDLISELAYINSDIDDVAIDELEAYRASVGLRGSFTDKFEGLVKANYIDGGDLDGDFSGTIGAQYKFTQTWGLTGEVEFGDGGETYLVGVRASF